MKTEQELKEYIFNLSWMEGAIGGSALDDLRVAMDLDSMDDSDIVFKLESDPNIDLRDFLGPDYEIPIGQTFVAYCTKHEMSECILVIENDYLTWNTI